MKMRSLLVTSIMGLAMVSIGVFATSRKSAADPPKRPSDVRRPEFPEVSGQRGTQVRQPVTTAQRPSAAELQRRQFMQAKLTTSNQIVKGLATEDFKLLRETAIEWIKIADSSSWKVRRDPLFVQYSRNFQSQAERLRRAAERESIEEATFAYVHATITCTACHQHVRGVIQVAPMPAADSGTRQRF